MLRILVIILSLAPFVPAKDLPKYLQPYKCPKDKNYETCFIQSANEVIPLVAEGDAEYHIPKLNPMEVPFLQLIKTPTLSFNLTDIKIYGLEKFKLMSVRFSWDDNLYTSIFNGKTITVDGNYIADGKVMVMPIKGNGHFTLDLKNGTFKVTSMSSVFQKNGEDYHKLNDFRLDYHVDRLYFNLENLFEGNKPLGDRLNKFLNENWDLLVTDFGPGIARTVTGVIKNIYEQFCSEVPIKYFFKD